MLPTPSGWMEHRWICRHVGCVLPCPPVETTSGSQPAQTFAVIPKPVTVSRCCTGVATDLFGLKLLSSLSYITKQTHLQIPKHVIPLILFLAALWVGNTPAVKFGLQDFQPIAAAAIRFALGIVVIISWTVIKRISLRPKQENYGRLLLLGTVFVAQIISFNWLRLNLWR